MYTKTKLQFILGAILMLSFAVTACNNSETDKAVVKDSASSTEIKTVVAPAVKDTMDTIPGNQGPTPGGGGN